VLDPFCGSGSTLIACEKSGRRAAVVELEAKYVDVSSGVGRRTHIRKRHWKQTDKHLFKWSGRVRARLHKEETHARKTI